jgi:hypothetical protein
MHIVKQHCQSPFLSIGASRPRKSPPLEHLGSENIFYFLTARPLPMIGVCTGGRSFMCAHSAPRWLLCYVPFSANGRRQSVLLHLLDDISARLDEDRKGSARR